MFKSKVNKKYILKVIQIEIIEIKHNFWDEKYTDEIKVRTNSTEEKNSELED